MNHRNYTFSKDKHLGLSLVELMVALLISSLLMLGLVTSFKNSSDSQKELEKSGILIENGRFAMNIITEDLKLAGFYGYYTDLTNPPSTLQDPCVLTTAGLTNAILMPIQAYTAASITADPVIAGTSCGSLLTAANLKEGSDILVVRRADTDIYVTADDGAPLANDIYIQSNSRTYQLFTASATANVDGTVQASQTVDGNAVAAGTTLRKYPSATQSPWVVGKSNWADTRKLRVHVYFVAPCSIGTAANGVCQSSDDDIPTLKRLELTSNGTSTIMEIVPLVEGIEFLRLEYGIDTSPSSANAYTGQIGDGIPDSYITTPNATTSPDVVTVRVYIVARSTDTTLGYTDEKIYTVGTVSPLTLDPNDSYKRQVFNAEVRPVNLSGRREIPE